MKNPLAALRQFRADARLGREARDVFSDLKSPAPWFLDFLGTGTKSGANIGPDTCFNVSVFSACLNVLSQSIAMLPCVLMRRDAAGSTPAPDHPLSPLLRRKPSGVQTAYQWRAHKVLNACLGGNGYSRIWRNSYAEITAITPLQPAQVRPMVAGEGTQDERMVYHWRGETLQDFEVIHLRGLSSNGWTGRSVLHDLRESLGLALTAQEFTASTFRNGNRIPGVLKGPATWDQSKAGEFLSFLGKNYAGAANAGKTRLFYGGVEWQSAGFSNQDAELLMSRRFEVEEIASAFRIPLTLLNRTEGASQWGTAIEKLMRGFVTFTLQPWLVNFEQELEDKLLTEAEKSSGYFIKFNVDSLLRGDALQRAQIYQILRTIRAIKINEIRELEDLHDLPDHIGDNVAEPFNTAGGAPAPASQSGATADATDGGDNATQ